MKKQHELFLDMDGVVVDLDALFIDKFGKTLKEMEKTDRNRIWVEEFDETWFLDAPPMKDMDRLLSWATSRFSKVRFLTALPNRRPDKTLESMHAKLQWVHRHVGRHIPVTFGPHAIHKQLHCEGSHHILIDDNDQNIRQWGLKGGISILHISAEKSILETEKFLT